VEVGVLVFVEETNTKCLTNLISSSFSDHMGRLHFVFSFEVRLGTSDKFWKWDVSRSNINFFKTLPLK
jgi:hypothetical protein